MTLEPMGSSILVRFFNGTWLIKKVETGYFELYYWSNLINGWYSSGVGKKTLAEVLRFF